jgi:hypothetical protein
MTRLGMVLVLLSLASCARPVGSVYLTFSIAGDDDNSVRKATFVEGNDMAFSFKGASDAAFERFSAPAGSNPINTKLAFPLDEDVTLVVAVADTLNPSDCLFSGATTFLVPNQIFPAAAAIQIEMPLTAGGEAATTVDPDVACRR